MLQSLPARRVTRFVPLLALATVVVAAPRPAAADASEPTLDRTVFEQLKSLAGRWEGKVDDASATPVALELQVTSNGTAVLERVFAGQPNEMTTVYYLARGQLLATHYCSLGNQPRLAPSAKPTDIVMDFAGGIGFDPATDHHAHGVRIQSADPGRLRVEWQFRKGEADPTYARMTLQRVAAAAATPIGQP
jgi:hypothetical protein